MNREKLGEQIYYTTHEEAAVTLSAGQSSTEYFKLLNLLGDNDLLAATIEQMSELIPEGTEVLAGIELGADPWTVGIGLRKSLPIRIIRKKLKQHGMSELIEGGPVKGLRAVLIEDVITTGRQTLRSVRVLRKAGGVVGTVVCVLLREENTAEQLAKEGLNVRPLFTRTQLQDLID